MFAGRMMLAGAVLVTEEPTLFGKGFIARGQDEGSAGRRVEASAETQVGASRGVERACGAAPSNFSRGIMRQPPVCVPVSALRRLFGQI